MLQVVLASATILSAYHAFRHHRKQLLLKTYNTILKKHRASKPHHVKSLSQENPEYIPRQNVKHVNWDQTDNTYAPVIWTHSSVIQNSKSRSTGHKWADSPRNFNMKTKMTLLEDVAYPCSVVIDICPETGAPLNPYGRTGMGGRGLLGKWGPNHAGDPVVTRYHPKTKKLQIIVITRKDNAKKALPGGMVDPDEMVWVTIEREFAEEAGNITDEEKKEQFNKLKRELFENGTVLYRGYVDDPRNTDNAWMETTAMHFHCNEYVAEHLPLEAGDDARAVEWMDITKKNLETLYSPTHRHFIELAMKNMESYQSQH
jgi:ADP-ribose pyrophosphatase